MAGLRLTFQLFVILYSLQGTLGNSQHYRLIDDLLKSYRPDIRPVKNITSVTHVRFKLFINLVLNMDETARKLISNTWVTLEWTDEYLTWNSSQYGGIDNLKILADRIWIPDIYLVQNSAQKYINWIKGNLAVVYSEGIIVWAAPVIYEGHCVVDPVYFPFDKQMCEMRFSSWSYGTKELLLSGYSGGTSIFVTDGEWDLQNLTAENRPEEGVIYKIYIQRRPMFYIFYLLMPCVLMSFITVFAFFLPPENPGKVSLGITILLTTIVFLSLLGDFMPPSKDQVPVLGRYYIYTMGLVSVSIAMNVIVINLHYKGHYKDSPKVPQSAYRFLAFNLAPLIGINSEEDDKANIAYQADSPPIFTKKKNERDWRITNFGFKYFRDSRNHRHVLNGRNSTVAGESQRTILLYLILKEFTILRNHTERKIFLADNLRQWKIIAKVINRVCLLSYILGLLVTSFLFLIEMSSAP